MEAQMARIAVFLSSQNDRLGIDCGEHYMRFSCQKRVFQRTIPGHREPP
jgi:hypothetical protein